MKVSRARSSDDLAQQLSALLEVSRSTASILDLEPLLDVILDQLDTIVDSSRSSVSTLEGDEFVVRAWRAAPGIPPPPAPRVPLELVMEGMAPLTLREPVLIADVQGDDALALAYRAWATGLGADVSEVGSYIAVPLVARDNLLGLLALNHRERGHFQQSHLSIVQAFAAQVL